MKQAPEFIEKSAITDLENNGGSYMRRSVKKLYAFLCMMAMFVVMIPLSPSVLAALRYVLAAEPSRILSFTLEENELGGFSKVSETYLLSHLGHSFDTLDFYKMIL